MTLDTHVKYFFRLEGHFEDFDNFLFLFSELIRNTRFTDQLNLKMIIIIIFFCKKICIQL